MQLLPTNAKKAKTTTAKAILCHLITFTNLSFLSSELRVASFESLTHSTYSPLAIRYSPLAAVPLLATRYSLPFTNRQSPVAAVPPLAAVLPIASR